MSFFSKLKATLSATSAAGTASASAPAPATVPRGPSWRLVLTAIGVTTPTCPHCGHAFDKMPQRKRACLKCSAVFYSRKRSLDGAKVLLTESDAREGEAQDALVTLTQEGVSDADLDALVHALQGQLGRVPTADEVLTQHRARAAAAHAESLDWGLYRNARFNLAESCVRRGQHENALRLLIEVSLLDLNGPRNCGGSKDPELLRRFPPFEPKTAFLAPGIINRTVEIIDLLKLSPSDTRSMFDSVAGSVGPTLKLPRSATSVWRELSKALVDAQG